MHTSSPLHTSAFYQAGANGFVSTVWPREANDKPEYQGPRYKCIIIMYIMHTHMLVHMENPEESMPDLKTQGQREQHGPLTESYIIYCPQLNLSAAYLTYDCHQQI